MMTHGFNKEIFNNISIVSKHIFHIIDYDKFIAYYYSSLNNRMKMIIFNKDTFKHNYNIERFIVDNFNPLNVFELYKNSKKLLINTLRSYHINLVSNIPNCLLLLNNNNITKPSIKYIDDILQHLNQITDFYKNLYPDRYLNHSEKNTIIFLKYESYTISGTLVPMSVLYCIGINNGIIDMNLLKEQLVDNEELLLNNIYILEQNDLIQDNKIKIPTKNIILKENYKIQKKYIDKQIKYDRNTIIRCYIMKIAKQFRNDTTLTSNKLYKLCKSEIKYFNLEYKEFISTANKLVNTESLYKYNNCFSFDMK
jgi:hypothetical protein